jgi:hypothetical protein
MRRFTWLGGALLLFFVVYYAFLCWSDIELSEALARLDQDDPGWRLDDIEAARATIPDDENSARIVVAARALLPDEWKIDDITTAVTALQAGQHLDASEYGHICNELNEWQPALVEARKLADFPRGRHQLTFSRPNIYLTLLKDQQKVRAIGNLLTFDALRRAEELDFDGALSDCRAALNCGRSIGDEPLVLSSLIRRAAVTNACTTSILVLGEGEPSASALKVFQTALEEENAYPLLPLATRGERACLHELMTGIEDGAVPMSLVTNNNKESSFENMARPVIQPKIKSEHAQLLSLLTRYYELVQRPDYERIAVEAALDNEIRAAPRTSIFIRMLMPAMSQMSVRDRRNHAIYRSAIVCLAAERFRLTRGKWPANLEELVPNELSAIPLDAYDGKPIRYIRLPDGIAVYCVGQDGVDDGGKTLDLIGFKPGTDCGFRLWDPAKRRQEPKPQEDDEISQPR